ncbi:hypothetical protein CKO15_01080 [Halorhodospira abdelmalekii]|uniref:glycosyltransferase family A protein n=1 Tax=Halorhodospira abdelmalekii TaxID=421629 RepID=UPI001905ACB6|nr:glycosyltransferase family A protein [Halorhodospira abdelmalekii]MBK1733894.1 hypothetical protein [Halorhodospira abdelmalekii]
MFTVIIPVHNKRPHLVRCLESLRAQTEVPWEAIAVDDASDDGSIEILQDYSRQLPLRLFSRSTPGPGGYAARNLAIAHARGEWLTFLDADDAWEPGYLAEIARLQHLFPQAAVLGTGYRLIDSDHEQINRFTRNVSRQEEAPAARLIDVPTFLESYIYAGGCFQTSATAVRRDILLQAGGFPEGRARQGGDVDTWLRCMLLARCGAWSPSIRVRYHRDATNRVTADPANLHDPHPVAVTVTQWLTRLEDSSERDLLRRFGAKKGLKRMRDAARAGIMNRRILSTLTLAGTRGWLQLVLLLPTFLWHSALGANRRATQHTTATATPKSSPKEQSEEMPRRDD